ncbi:unnamed protein product [Lupinus luteus]|uniref:Transmembrane protein n=1 Tax=Lupinus luteus TaxID=3873 RepID=A0AAV1XG11_LUPLU
MVKPSMSLPSSRSGWKPFKASSKMNHQLHSPSSSFLHFDFFLVSSFLFLPCFFIYFSKSSKLFASNPISIAEIHLQSLKSASFIEIPSNPALFVQIAPNPTSFA